jgi:hypothetical protein
VPKGGYTVDAYKIGYSAGSHGRHRPDGVGQTLQLDEGERTGPLRITIWKEAAITGRLIDDAGEPFVGATVWSLKRSYAIGRSQFIDGPSGSSDDRGIYRVSGLTAGEHIICVVAATSTLPAAVLDGYAQARVDGTTAEYQRAFMSATIGFSAGISTPGIRMGDLILQPVGPYSRGMTPPGPDARGRVLAFQTTFYPSSVDIARAEVITLAPGEERAGADIRLHLVPTAPVTGRVTGPTGPVAGIGVRLAPSFSAELGSEQTFEAATALTDANGAFTFLGVPAGDYTLRALKLPPAPAIPQPPIGARPTTPPPPPPLPKEPTLWANVPITVGADGLRDIDVQLQTGFRITGRFEFQGSLPRPRPELIQTLTMFLQPLDGHQIGYQRALSGRTDPDGTVTSYEIPPGRYVVRMSAPSESWEALAGWSYKASMLGPRDVGAVPLEVDDHINGVVIVMTDRPSELAGTVRTQQGRPDPAAAVIVFSANPDDWLRFGTTPRRNRYIRPTADGVFRWAALPAGDYYVAAIPEAEADVWQDPRVLRLLTRSATRVTIGEGEKRTLDVVTRPVR